MSQPKPSYWTYVVDLLHLILDWRLAAIIRQLPMPKPGEVLLVADQIVLNRILESKWPVDGVVPIFLVDSIDDISVLSFKELSDAYSRAYEAHCKGTYGQFEAAGGQAGRAKQVAN